MKTMRFTADMTGWTKTGRKEYTHETGIIVRYDCNRFYWVIVGGQHNGMGCTTLWATIENALR
jgi:hypothetical protein